MADRAFVHARRVDPVLGTALVAARTRLSSLRDCHERPRSIARRLRRDPRPRRHVVTPGCPSPLYIRMDGLSDVDALRRSRTDPDAICELYDRYHAPLLRALLRRGHDRELAFEILQETFARALEHGHRVRLAPDGTAWPWLWSVARNLMTDALRRGVVDARARDRLGYATVPYDADALDELLDRIAGGELAEKLGRAVDDLPAQQQEALAGRVERGLTYRELSEATGASEQVLRARVARGLRTLRLRLVGEKS
jgi:RNA polymerase sigma factor (sigma-70 family)